VDEHPRVKTEPGSDCCEEPGDAEIQPIDGDEPAARAGNHTHRIGVHASNRAADALSDKEEAEAEPEAQLDRTDDAQVEGTEPRGVAIVAKQANPQHRMNSDNPSHGSKLGRNDGPTGVCDGSTCGGRGGYVTYLPMLLLLKRDE